MDIDNSLTGLPGEAAPAEPAGGRRRHRAGPLARLRFSWWAVGGIGFAALVGVAVPVGATGPLSPAPSEGLMCTTSASPNASFVVTASDGYITTPDGNSIYMWGFSPGGRGFQYPGPNLCVNQGDTVTVTLRNSLKVATSMTFNGIQGVTANGLRANPDPTSGSLTTGAAPGASVTYRFTADHAGTFLYESGTNPSLQDQMGLVGALIVRPQGHPDYVYNDAGTTVTSAAATTTYTATTAADSAATWTADQWKGHTVVAGGTVANVLSNDATTLTLDASVNLNTTSGWQSGTTPTSGTAFTILALDTRFAPGKEYLHLLSEIDPDLHQAVERGANSYDMTKYKARYYMINGRSFPDTIAPNFASQLPAQPYGALVHVLPRSAANPLPAVVRYLNTGPVTYPFHPHSNHEKIVGVDGHELVNLTAAPGALPADVSVDHFGIVVAPGQTEEGMFSWVDAQNWDPNTNPIGVPIPNQENRFEGPYWNGSPYLGDRAPLADGVVRYNQCGEFYHVAHSHALFQVTNYGFSGGGMLTMVRIDPPAGTGAAAGTPRSDCIATGR